MPTPRSPRSLRRATQTACLCLLSCTHPPDVAAPRGGSLEPDTPPGDWIRYRKLVRGDFKRVTAPDKIREGPYELGAQTCAYLKTDPGVGIAILETKEPDGDERVEGRLRNLRFSAWMDRPCSWWNPSNGDVGYTLEHEQVHFAISEIHARQLNQEAAELVRNLHVTAPTQAAVVQKLQSKVKALLDVHTAAMLGENRAFDEDTSVGKDPPRQEEWAARVERELDALKAWQ